jgi:enamine deaminase RidA (YjgF/YER057c/UK114 family)
MPKTRINPDSVPSTLEYGFAQGVLASGRRTLYLSGQTAWDPEKQIVGGADLGAQATQAFGNVRRIVEAAGGTVEDVVSLRIYVVDYRPAHAEAVRSALHTCFPGVDKPATTWLGVAALARPGFLIEVEAVAVLD